MEQVGLRNRLFRHSALAIAIILLCSVNALAGSAPFPFFYSGTEDLVLRRLKLDPSAHPVDALSKAEAAVIQDQLPAGAQLEALKARINDGLGLLLILGRHTDSAALTSLTDGALEQVA